MIIERRTTPPASAYATLAQIACVHVRVDDGDSEMEVERHYRAAAAELEAFAQLALINQSVRVTLECWPRSLVFPLPIAPVLDPLSVTVSADGEDVSAFAVITGQRPAIRMEARPAGVVVIEYEAGFGETAEDIPADLAAAIADQAAALFDFRGAGDGKSNGMSPHMARIAARYRRVAI